jgi:Fe-S oxidoreductase
VPAVFHSGILWGFVILTIGTILATLDWDIAHLILGGQFLTGNVYKVYEAVLDTVGVLFIAGLLIAMWRRYVVKPHFVLGAWDFVLWSLLVINVSGFLLEGLRLSIELQLPAAVPGSPPMTWGGWSWAGSLLAGTLFAGLDLAALSQAHLWVWLGHAGAAFVFLAAIPFTNAVHMVTTSANAVLKTVEPIAPGAALVPIQIDTAEFFGVGKLSEFNWKQRLGVDACTRCGRCEQVCPAYMSGTPLNPKGIIVGLSNQLREELDRPGWPTGVEEPLVVGDGMTVEPSALWACTTCMACVNACPALIEIVDDIVDMRRYLTLTEGAPPGTAAASMKNMGTAGNPWGYSPSERHHWAEGLDVPRIAPGERYEVLYWVGCSAAYDKRNQRIARAMVRVMRAAGVRFAVLEQERCTAESARRLGEEYLYQTVTAENVENLNGVEFDRVVCHCPHCFNTIKNEYPQFGGNYDVVHHSQLIQELVAAGRLAGIDRLEQRVAFHDSCFLGRYNGEFEAPRDTLRAAGVDVVELPRNRANGLCCGGGGGHMWFEQKAVKDINAIRLDEALSVKPDVVGVACPFCLTMLDSAAKSAGNNEVEILDVAEVLARALDRSDASRSPSPSA